jgi:hypothetical protein
MYLRGYNRSCGKPITHGEMTMIRDRIVEEVRRVRRATEAACGNDWGRLLEYYRLIQRPAVRPTRRAAKP